MSARNDDRIAVPLAQRLLEREGEIARRLVEGLCSAQTPRYQRSERALLETRAQQLIGALCEALAEGRPLGFAQFVEALAEQRRAEGYDVSEVQSALNLLQAEGWLEVTRGGTGQQLDELTRLSATVGMAKDLLARCYARGGAGDEGSAPPLVSQLLMRGTVSGPQTDG